MVTFFLIWINGLDFNKFKIQHFSLIGSIQVSKYAFATKV